MAKKERVKEKKNYTGIIILIMTIVVVFLVIVPILFLVFLGAALSFDESGTIPTGSGNVAHIKLTGVILTETSDSLFGASSDTSSREFVKILRDIEDDSSIDAILIEINSPGGSGVASDEISQVIKDIDKPVVSYVREVGASGAYWVASSTDYIIANRMSTVGSIGVIASYLDFSEFIEEYNVSYQRFVAGDNKDFGTPFKEVTQQQETQFQAILDELHGFFIAEVAEGRKMSISEIELLADGSIFTGSQGLENGLVDALGTQEDAILYLENQLGTRVSLVSYQKQLSFFDSLAGYMAKNMYAIGVGIGQSFQSEELLFRV